MKVAALFVDPRGIYSGRLNVDAWDIERDARLYRGPWPVVAHPPCKRWGRYWSGGPSVKTKRHKGDDDGCFAAALWAVRTFGGVIEHPEASHAWAWFGLPRPERSGGWNAADAFGGRSCCVEQGHYGHRARKATWLYLAPGIWGIRPEEFTWGPSTGLRLDAGFHSAEERAAAGEHGRDSNRITPKEAMSTPQPFAERLINICWRAVANA